MITFKFNLLLVKTTCNCGILQFHIYISSCLLSFYQNFRLSFIFLKQLINICYSEFEIIKLWQFCLQQLHTRTFYSLTAAPSPHWAPRIFAPPIARTSLSLREPLASGLRQSRFEVRGSAWSARYLASVVRKIEL